jgi:hypothetical protein
MKRGSQMELETWKTQNLINMAFDLGATKKEIRAAFEGSTKDKEFMEKQLQTVLKSRTEK